MTGNCKYYKQERYVSFDSGQTWSGTGVYSQGALIESASTDCGYVPPVEPQYRDVSGTPYCSGASGYDKYVDVYSQVSYDSGQTWTTTATTPTLVEANSEYCHYVPPTPSYENQYLTFRTTSGSMHYKLTLPYSSHQEPCQVYYSLDSGNTWVGHDFEESTPAVPNGSIIMWKGTNSLTSTTRGTFSSSGGTFEIEGNLASLGNMQPSDVYVPTASYYWSELFKNNTGLTSAENLYIPRVDPYEASARSGMFAYMFSGCTNLVLPPDFSHVFEEDNFISDSFFRYTFADCTSLTTVPNLSPSFSSISTSGCCGMFQNCTSLTTVPKNYLTVELSDYLDDRKNSCYCYAYMFQGCTSLVSAPDLLAANVNCQSYLNMFQGCTSLTTSPLMANTRAFLRTGGCRQMFEGCTSLSAITCLASGITPYNENTLYHWVDGVAESGEFNRLASGSISWSIGIDGIPSGWIIRDVTTGATYWSGTTSGSPYCNGYDKYIDIYHQISSDSGSTWTTTATTQTLVEANSEDCGYVPPYDYATQYLTFRPHGDTTFQIVYCDHSNPIYYSLDSGSTWTSLAIGTNSPVVHSGETIMWKCNAHNNTTGEVSEFASSGSTWEVEGNVMSLLFSDNFSGQTSIEGNADYIFAYMFNGCSGMTSAENMVLPTILGGRYGDIYGCFVYMFSGCTSLTTAPTISATTLTTASCGAMFYGCSSLNSVTCLATTITNKATSHWLDGVAASGTFTTPSSTQWESGVSGIPEGWTRVNI